MQVLSTTSVFTHAAFAWVIFRQPNTHKKKLSFDNKNYFFNFPYLNNRISKNHLHHTSRRWWADGWLETRSYERDRIAVQSTSSQEILKLPRSPLEEIICSTAIQGLIHTDLLVVRIKEIPWTRPILDSQTSASHGMNEDFVRSSSSFVCLAVVHTARNIDISCCQRTKQHVQRNGHASL